MLRKWRARRKMRWAVRKVRWIRNVVRTGTTPMKWNIKE